MKYFLSLTLFIIFSTSAYARTIHKERSIYRNIVITEKNSKRCMRFESRQRSVSNQACINLKDFV